MKMSCQWVSGLFCLAVITAADRSVVAQLAESSAPADRAPILVRQADRAPKLLVTPVGMSLAASPVDVLSLPVIDQASIGAQDVARDTTAGVPYRVGISRQLPHGPVTMDNAGSWFQVNGYDVWSICVDFPGAIGVRLHFSRFHLPAGGRIILQGDGSNGSVVYENSGPRGTGEFWSEALSGQRVTIEYQTPASVTTLPTFQLDEASHLYRDAGLVGAAPVSALAAQALLPCQEDVSCHAVDPMSRDAVGRMLFTISGQGTFVCTGTLLNDSDPNTFAGYFLTANHCISTQAVTDTLQVRWLNQSSVCNGPVSGGVTTVGGTLLATSPNTDFTLIRLRDDPHDGQGFAAWTTATPTGTVRGIHHPGGSFKRFSEGVVTTTQPLCDACCDKPLVRYVYNDWTIGITEGGSSGSPLFNTNWEVVGQLFGTCQFAGVTPACTNPQDYNNLYGRFSVSFSSISSFLTGVIPDDVFEDNDTLAQAAPLEFGTHALRLVDFDDYFRLTVCEAGQLSLSAIFSTADMNLDLTVLDEVGTVLGASATFGGSEAVLVPVTPGVYVVHATKTAGWGGDYSLAVGMDNMPFPCAAAPEAPLPPAAPENLPKQKFVSFIPANLGVPVSFQVVAVSNGATKWVGWCPDLDTATAQAAGCTSDHPSKNIAVLVDTLPPPRIWDAQSVVHVTGCMVQPGHRFEIRATSNGVSLSGAMVRDTVDRWGDTNADATVDIIDVVSSILVVVGSPTARYTHTQVDVDADVPSGTLTIVDVVTAIMGFRESSIYPFTPFGSCP